MTGVKPNTHSVLAGQSSATAASLMKKFVIFAIIVLAWCSAADATSYYVSTVGSDSNDGLSIGTAFLTPTHAAGVTNPGDVVNFMPGLYGGGTGGGVELAITRSGSAGGGYITYQSYNQGQNGYAVLMSKQGGQVVSLAGPISYITIQNLEIAGPLGSLSLATAWANPSSSALYKSEGILQFTATAVTLATNGATSIGNSTLSFGSTPGVSTGAVVYDQTHPTAIPSGAVITGSPGTSTTISVPVVSPGVSSGDTIQFINPSHHLQFLNNYVHDVPGGGIQTGEADYVTVSGNTVINTSSLAPFGSSGISIYSSRDVDTNTGYKTIVTGNLVENNLNLLGDIGQGPTLATNAGTASGTTLHFASTSGVAVNQTVFDSTAGAAITPGSYVVSFVTNTSVTLSAAVASAVGSGDSIIFAPITDGEGIIIDDNQGNQVNTAPYGGRTLVSNNIAVNNGSAGILAFDSSHVDFTFNTLYQNQTTFQQQVKNVGDLWLNNGSDQNAFNNIIYVTTGNQMIGNNSNTSTTWGNNLAFNGIGTVPGTNNVTGQDPLFVAPTIVNLPQVPLDPTTTAFQLQPGSPAIDAGSATFTRTVDFLGNPGLTGPSYDIGAYETPCSPFGSNTVQSIATLTTNLASNQGAGFISAQNLRNLTVSLSCGRSPYAH